MIIVSLLGSTADAQRNVTAISGQKILILSDGRWIYSPVENQNDANKTAEMPIMVSKTIENIQLLQRAAEKKEVEKFLVFELFKKDLDSKKVQILNAKKLRNKDEEKKLSNDAVYSYPQKSDSKLNKFFYTKFAVYDKEKINISI